LKKEKGGGKMKVCLPKFVEELRSLPYVDDVKEIRYIGQGRKLHKIGFIVKNQEVTIGIEPKNNYEWFVVFNSTSGEHPRWWHSCHYARKRNGFLPTLCKDYIFLKSDILNFLKSSKNGKVL
jgi:hypothetical protein